MKKYYVCFFILAVLLAAAVLTGAYYYLYRPQQGNPIPNSVTESESFAEENMAMIQDHAGQMIPGAKDAGSQAQMAAGPADAAKAELSQHPAGSEGGNPDGETPDGELRYCLVAEDGFLLVFARERDSVCLDTHMPLSEFPEAEQERLTNGIWFSTMLEVFNYLESYSS